MHKVITAFKRRPGMSVEDFRSHWQMARDLGDGSMDGVRHYVQNTPAASAYRDGREPAFDAIEEIYLDSQDSDNPATGIAHQLGQSRMEECTDPGGRVALLVDEVALIDGPRTPTKLMMFVRRRTDLSVGEFQEHWRDVHGPIAARNAYLRRYVQCHVSPSGAAEETRAFDGVGMVWFDSPEDMRASGTTPDAAEANSDGQRFVQGGAPHATLVVTENVVLS